MTGSEVKISTLQVGVQHFIKKDEAKWNPDFNETLNDNELSALLSNYGTDNVRDLQKGFMDKIIDSIFPNVLDAEFVGEHGRIEVEYTNGKTKNYSDASIAQKRSGFGTTGLTASALTCGLIASAGGWALLALPIGLGLAGLATKISYNAARADQIRGHLESSETR